MLPHLWNDLRYAARSLRRSPGFATAAIATIALGVGINTGIFTVLNGVLFRDLPAQSAHELVFVSQTIEGGPDREGASAAGLFSTSEYRTYRDRTQTLSGMIGHSDPTRTTLGGAAPQAILGALVTCNSFEVLRQPPAIGRGLTAQDCEAGASPVVVLGHDIRTTTFSADPAVVGRTVELNRQSLTIVGVASEGTDGGFPYRTAYFAPISTEPLLLPNENAYDNDKNSWLFLTGRRRGIPPPAIDPSPDVRVLSFALALTFGTGLLFGLAPALQASNPDLLMAIKQDASGTGSRRGSRLQGTLVGVQVALCMVLMIGAGLLVRALFAAQTIAPGFVYRNVAVASYDLAAAGYDPEEAAVFQRQLMERAAALPGVETVAYAWREPSGDDLVYAIVRLRTWLSEPWRSAGRNLELSTLKMRSEAVGRIRSRRSRLIPPGATDPGRQTARRRCRW